MPKISPDEYRDRRARIMNAARRCFLRDGIHIAVDDICAEAGVSKGALYGYFRSKDAIIQAIADEHVANLSAIRDATTPEQLVAALLERMTNGDRESCRLELEAWAYSLAKEPLRKRLLENTGELRVAIQQALEQIRRDNRAKDADGSYGALLIETVAMGIVANAALGRDAEAERLLSEVVRKATSSA